MADENDDTTTDDTSDTTDDDTGTDPSPKPAEKTYTQAEVDALDKKLKRQAAKAAEKSLAETLGVTVEEAKQVIEAQRAAAEAEKSDAQKAKEAADAAKAEAEAAQAAAALEVTKAKLQQALMTPGENPEETPAVRQDRVEAAMALALPAAMADDSDDPIAVAVEHARAMAPEIFGSPSGDEGGKPPVSAGTPGRPAGQRKRSGPSTPEDKAAATLQRFREKQAKPPIPHSST